MCKPQLESSLLTWGLVSSLSQCNCGWCDLCEQQNHIQIKLKSNFCAGAQKEIKMGTVRSMSVRGKERTEVLNESLALGYCSKKGKYFRYNIKGILRKSLPLLVSLSLIYWLTHRYFLYADLATLAWVVAEEKQKAGFWSTWPRPWRPFLRDAVWLVNETVHWGDNCLGSNLLFTSSVTLGKLLSLSELQFSHW